MVHIGKAIEAEMRRQERTPSWLARKINCERTNVYYIFSQASINTDMLIRISRALNHDFFQDLSQSLSEPTF
ncbi:MAG: XRE family transcriptional regulator [Muribaculaceae bacterium]|nr:XRE family transcriptional regulator [Muribaculaceae bacterium]